MIKTPFKLDIIDKKLEQKRSFSEQQEEQARFERIVAEVVAVVLPKVIAKIPAPVAGKNGRDGIDGKPGKNGLDGKNGLPGARGKDGKDGKNGESVSLDDVLEKLEPFKEEIRRIVRNATQPKQLGGGGGDSMNYNVITSSTTLSSNSKVTLVDTTNGVVTVTLPSASRSARKEYHIKKNDATNNQLVIQPNGSETIDGETSITIANPYVSVRLYSTGSNWVII